MSLVIQKATAEVLGFPIVGVRRGSTPLPPPSPPPLCSPVLLILSNFVDFHFRPTGLPLPYIWKYAPLSTWVNREPPPNPNSLLLSHLFLRHSMQKGINLLQKIKIQNIRFKYNLIRFTCSHETWFTTA